MILFDKDLILIKDSLDILQETLHKPIDLVQVQIRRQEKLLKNYRRLNRK